MRPRVVLVTGVPGSGKTVLSTELARRLRVPFIARDDIRGGLLMTAGAWTDELSRIPPGDEAVEVFLGVVEGLLAQDVSCVIEYVVRANRSQDLDRILAAGDCVVIMVHCDDPMARVVQRNCSDRLIANRALLDAAGFESVEDHTTATVERMQQVGREMLQEFPVPVLHVDTTGPYDPDLDAVLAFAIAPTGSR